MGMSILFQSKPYLRHKVSNSYARNVLQPIAEVAVRIWLSAGRDQKVFQRIFRLNLAAGKWMEQDITI